MASNEEKMEDALSCPICADVFKQPVALPCQHCFCRVCLQVLSETKNNPSAISCPVCRQVAKLGKGGVAGLPVSFILAGVVENFQPPRKRRRIEDDEAPCGVSEDGSVERPKTDRHRQALSIYCFTCHELICLGCFNQHNKHSFSDTGIAVEKQKVPFLEKIKMCKETKDKVGECLQDIQKLIDDIKDQQKRNGCEIQRAYDATLKALETWRQTALGTAEQHYKEWLEQCDTMIKDLQVTEQDMQSFCTEIMEFTSLNEVGFLQEVNKVSSRIDEHIDSSGRALKKHADLVVENNNRLKDNACPFIYLNLTEKSIKKPMLKFREGSDSTGTNIKEGGLLLEEKSPEYYNDVFTDVTLQSGQYYWEFEVTVNLEDECDSHCRCLVGLESRICGIERLVPGKTYWGIKVHYSDDLFGEFKYSSIKGCSRIMSGYSRYIPYPGHQNLGFYLDCEKRTLTAIDCAQNRIIWTQGGIDVSQPLTPFIVFGCRDDEMPANSVSARLVTRPNKTLQNIVDLLKLP